MPSFIHSIRKSLDDPAVTVVEANPGEVHTSKKIHFNGKVYHPFTNLHHSKSAMYRLSPKQIGFIVAIFAIITAAFIVNWHGTLVLIFAALTLFYFAHLLFNLYLVQQSFSQFPEIKISDRELAFARNREWPTYTIFSPLYKEWEVLPQFVTAMSRLDYPKDKLQVMLLMEEDDQATIQKAKECNLPDYFQITVIPHTFPKTKPKACNYGLTKATGEYVVIYDAEDVPDTLQLKKAVIAFEKSDPRIKCIQAKLNFYNPHQNILTRVFTAEYSLWFDLVLTGLQSIHAPIPLGGTSNHFRVKDLIDLEGWDPFNVTEDCDLGIRLIKRGYRTAVIDSLTLEEANSEIKNWFWQRTRWIKGYMQTYLVHMRDPRSFLLNWREPHVITFQLIVGGKILTLFINPLMWVTTIIYFAFRGTVGPFIESLFPTVVLYMAICSILIGNFLYLFYYMIGCYRREHFDLIKYSIFVPLYWLGMSVAAWVAVYQLIIAPHHWKKTRHGLHLNTQKSVDQVTNKIGRELVDTTIHSSREPVLYPPEYVPEYART